jgi:hypothetical protein
MVTTKRLAINDSNRPLSADVARDEDGGVVEHWPLVRDVDFGDEDELPFTD